MHKLHFGTAGIPLSTLNRNILNGIKRVNELGLGALELEFVHSVHIPAEKAPEVKKASLKNQIKLTAHGQYFINLNSSDPQKNLASKQRIYHAAKIASLCGADSMTFHAAFYQKEDPEKVYQQVKSGIQEVVGRLKDEGDIVWVRPETTGKLAQWGELKEILRLSQEMEQVLPCMDFAHLYARSCGKDNSLEDFRQMLVQTEKALGRLALDNMHIHMAGIHYSDKGERWHLNLNQSEFNYQDLLKIWKEFKIKGVVISESPNIEQDALLLKREYEK